MPILTGNSPYRESPYSLWAYKTRIIEAEPPDADTQELWDLGHALEPVIADRYALVTGRRVRRVNRMLQRPGELTWATASLDRVVIGEPIIVECKWVPHRSWTGPEAVPPYVQDQVQWQMYVTGYAMAHVAVLLGGKFEWHEVPADAAYQADLLAIARWFRGLLDMRTPPPIDASDATRRALVRRYPSDDGSVLVPGADMHALMRTWRSEERVAKLATARADAAANAVRAIMESHSEATSTGYVTSESGSWRVTYKKGAPFVSHDYHAIAQALRAELHDDFGVSDALLDAIEAEHAEQKDGHRTLRKTWRGEEAPWT
jgi:putative phage-type endonuclease